MNFPASAKFSDSRDPFQTVTRSVHPGEMGHKSHFFRDHSAESEAMMKKIHAEKFLVLMAQRNTSCGDGLATPPCEQFAKIHMPGKDLGSSMTPDGYPPGQRPTSLPVTVRPCGANNNSI